MDRDERSGTVEQQTIRAVEWTLEAPGRLQRTVTTLPTPAAGEILVRTVIGAISPGTERTLVQGLSRAVPTDAYPYQPGYLNVVEIIDAADRTLVGERGIAVLGHRDFALIPYHRFIRVPRGRSNDVALLGVLSADARNAIDLAAVESGEDCLVLGAGILGVLTAWELCYATKGTIRLVESNAARRELVDRASPKQDRRVVMLSVTPAGKVLAEAVYAEVAKRLPEITRNLDADDQRDFERVTTAIVDTSDLSSPASD